MEDFKLKSFYHLLDYDFHIPSFQRGYRWEQKQIEDLLNDFKEFYQDNETAKFYCLQPIVVKRRTKGKDVYDVLDGQQRLTTLYLILSYLGIKPFTLQFDTREEGEFLKKLFAKHDNDYRSNIDYFYIQKAYDVIGCWFSRDKKNKEIIKNLLSVSPEGDVKDDDLKDVRVIWYETNSDEDAKKVYSNLNYGKIGLTETELIKALILQCDVYGNEKPYMSQWSLNAASDWDIIEQELQKPTFMAMLATHAQLKESEDTLVSRIFFVLDLVAKYYLSKLISDDNMKYYKYKYEETKPEQQKKNTSLNNPRYVYYVIEQYLSGNGVKEKLPTFKERVAMLWDYILDTFSVLKDWYNNHKTYHLVGLLRLLDDDENLLFDLFTTYMQHGNNKLHSTLNEKIGERVKIKSIRKDNNGSDKVNTIDTINYNDNREEIISILELFNVELMIESHQDGARFDFAKFREQNVTSLEHIHPQNLDETKITFKDLDAWIERKEKELKKEEFEELRDDFSYFDSFDEIKFKDDREKCMYHVKNIDAKCNELAEMNEAIMHSIKNMALIDKDTNAALQNYFLDKKRNKLKERSEQGIYIPIGTWHVFNKFFTENVSDLKFWTTKDREAYFDKIKEVYNKYVN